VLMLVLVVEGEICGAANVRAATLVLLLSFFWKSGAWLNQTLLR
jgi:hypothetical protein